MDSHSSFLLRRMRQRFCGRNKLRKRRLLMDYNSYTSSLLLRRKLRKRLLYVRSINIKKRRVDFIGTFFVYFGKTKNKINMKVHLEELNGRKKFIGISY